MSGLFERPARSHCGNWTTGGRAGKETEVEVVVETTCPDSIVGATLSLKFVADSTGYDEHGNELPKRRLRATLDLGDTLDLYKALERFFRVVECPIKQKKGRCEGPKVFEFDVHSSCPSCTEANTFAQNRVDRFKAAVKAAERTP